MTIKGALQFVVAITVTIAVIWIALQILFAIANIIW